MQKQIPTTTQPEDMAKIRGLAERYFGNPESVPISFKLDGKLVWGLPADPSTSVERRMVDANVVETEFSWIDTDTLLMVRVRLTEYKDFPVLEWVAEFENCSDEPSPLISEILAFDGALEGKSPVLNHYKGDFYDVKGYEPFLAPLEPGAEKSFAPVGGRACDPEFPYYRVLTEGGGYTLSVGWPGQWATSFAGVENGVHVKAGQEKTSLRLDACEKVRTPRMTMMAWTGDVERSINLWRRWYLAHVLPRPNGKPMEPHCVGVGTGEGEEFTGATAENQVQFIDRYVKLGIPFDVWWIDAGWYPCYDDKHERRWWQTGTWMPDPERFPDGMKVVSDRLAKENAKLLVWFEPERIRPGTQLDKEHPDWLLKSDEENHLLNLGLPECRQWLTDHVCKLIEDNGIGIYRQDFNFPPLPRWRVNDPDDRQGMNENLYIRGYLQFWDDLLARNPGLWIDSCSSGGRRNDLETMRRSVPLHYTDFGYGDHQTKLAFHRTMFEWIPYFKECTLSWDIGEPDRYDPQTDSFAFHCAMAAMLFPTFDIKRDDYDYATVVKMVGVWRKVADLILYGDYYAHTPFHQDKKRWVALQFDSPETGQGFLQGFRLQECPDETLTVHPKAICSAATYELENPESGERLEVSGKALAGEGFTFELPKRAAAIWIYRKV